MLRQSVGRSINFLLIFLTFALSDFINANNLFNNIYYFIWSLISISFSNISLWPFFNPLSINPLLIAFVNLSSLSVFLVLSFIFFRMSVGFWYPKHFLNALLFVSVYLIAILLLNPFSSYFIGFLITFPDCSLSNFLLDCSLSNVS